MRSTSSSAGCQASLMRWTLQCHALTLSGRYLYASSARYLYTSPGGRHEEMACRVPRRRGGSLIVRRAPGAGAGLGRRPPPGPRRALGRRHRRDGRRRRARRPHRPARPPRLGDLLLAFGASITFQITTPPVWLARAVPPVALLLAIVVLELPRPRRDTSVQDASSTH